MTNNTPYQEHKLLNHKTTWHSPDGFVKIEECVQCNMRFLHNPSIGYPIAMQEHPSIWGGVSND